MNTHLYGAVELKRSYQRNMLVGELILVLTIAGLVLLSSVLLGSERKEAPPPDWTDRWDPVQLEPPPPRSIRVIEVIDHLKPPETPILSGIEAGEDPTVEIDFVLPSRDEISQYINSLDTTDYTGTTSSGSIPVVDEYIPHPDSFVAFSEAPVKVYFPEVRYPEIARKAGVEGKVWVRVLIDKSGNVLDAKVQQSSGTNAGFEEEAIAAALQSKWRPAMQNNQPIAIWISYEVRFKLH